MAKRPRVICPSLFVGSVSTLALLFAPGCQPKPAPQRLPPKEVPQLQGIGDKDGQRGNVVKDAVPVGSNLAHLQYDTSGATVSGTFACSSFLLSVKGCAGGERGTAECSIPRGSFSIAGCAAVNAPRQERRR